MRIALFLACASAALASCGGPQTRQANDAQGNISNDSQGEDAAAPSPSSNAMVLLGAGRMKPQALKIMHDRHEAMEGLGKAMKALHRELESGKPDINVVHAQTAAMASTAAKIPAMFPAGTGPDVGKTRAKAEIWSKRAEFDQKSKDFLVAARAIDAAARAGDLNKVMAVHDSVDRSCKACHDPFRAPEH